MKRVAVKLEAPEHEFREFDTILFSAKAVGRERAARDRRDAKENRMTGKRLSAVCYRGTGGGFGRPVE